MKAYVIEHAGGPEVLQLRGIPSLALQVNEVRIRVRAVGLNRADIPRRAGEMGTSAPEDAWAVPLVSGSGCPDSRFAVR